MEIQVSGNDVEKALKLLKRKLQREGLLKELKKRSYYKKPSVKMRDKRREAQKKRAKSARGLKTQRFRPTS